MRTLKNGIIDDFANCGALFKPTVGANAMPLNQASRFILQARSALPEAKNEIDANVDRAKHLN